MEKLLKSQAQTHAVYLCAYNTCISTDVLVALYDVVQYYSAVK